MKLENIGFYTLSDKRAKLVSSSSPIMRGEILLTDRCNLKCPYCRGVKEDLKGELDYNYINSVLDILLFNKI